MQLLQDITVNRSVDTSSPVITVSNDDSKHMKMGVVRSAAGTDPNTSFIAYDGDFRLIPGSGNSTEKFTLNSSGNATFAGDVNMASAKIESDGSAAAGAYLELHHNNNNSTDVCATINLTNNAGGYASIIGGTTGANNTGYIEFKTDNAGTQGTVLTLNGDNSATFAGNVTIPSYVFHSGDPNTYFGFSGNDVFQVNTAGGERMRITASGMKLSTSGATVSVILDEDNMSSNSATALATQQSIKAYVDNSISGGANYLGVWDPRR